MSAAGTEGLAESAGGKDEERRMQSGSCRQPTFSRCSERVSPEKEREEKEKQDWVPPSFSAIFPSLRSGFLCGYNLGYLLQLVQCAT